MREWQFDCLYDSSVGVSVSFPFMKKLILLFNLLLVALAGAQTNVPITHLPSAPSSVGSDVLVIVYGTAGTNASTRKITRDVLFSTYVTDYTNLVFTLSNYTTKAFIDTNATIQAELAGIYGYTNSLAALSNAAGLIATTKVWTANQHFDKGIVVANNNNETPDTFSVVSKIYGSGYDWRVDTFDGQLTNNTSLTLSNIILSFQGSNGVLQLDVTNNPANNSNVVKYLVIRYGTNVGSIPFYQ